MNPGRDGLCSAGLPAGCSVGLPTRRTRVQTVYPKAPLPCAIYLKPSLIRNVQIPAPAFSPSLVKLQARKYFGTDSFQKQKSVSDFACCFSTKFTLNSR